MKIIEKCTWKHEFTCSSCKSICEAEADDVFAREEGCFDEFETNFYVCCPVCGVDTKIKSKKLPAHVRDNARTR